MEYVGGTFDGITLSETTFRDDFQELIETGYAIIYEDKEYLQHEEEDFVLFYKYVIEVLDIYEATGDDEYEDKMQITVDLVVMPGSLRLDFFKEIMKGSGLEKAEEVGLFDVISYGGASVTVASEMVDRNEVDHKLKVAKMIVPVIDSLRGFYLDKPVNRVGETGWDVLKQATGRIPSFD